MVHIMIPILTHNRSLLGFLTIVIPSAIVKFGPMNSVPIMPRPCTPYLLNRLINLFSFFKSFESFMTFERYFLIFVPIKKMINMLIDAPIMVIKHINTGWILRTKPTGMDFQIPKIPISNINKRFPIIALKKSLHRKYKKTRAIFLLPLLLLNQNKFCMKWQIVVNYLKACSP